MSGMPATAPRMKTRDIVKYCFAALLGLFTVFAIGTLSYAKQRRQNRPADEARRIEERLEAYGTRGTLPGKMEVSQQQPVSVR